MNFLIIPDSFKGTMTSKEVCNIIANKILQYFPDGRVTAIPVADGGEGTVDAFFAAMGGELVTLNVPGPFGETVAATYLIHGKTAIVEMAQAAGLSMVADRLNPLKASTYGVGVMMKDAVQRGCKEIVLGLGGSCTNDGGAGMAAALGTVFTRADGSEFVPAGGTLSEIAHIDCTKTQKLLDGVTVTAMCDIDNPMYGTDGAAYIFAPQKGADADAVKLLDENLKVLSEQIKQHLRKDVSRLPGAGAAGAMGAGVAAFLDGILKSGIETVLNTVDFDRLLQDTDLVFTGEGKLDEQSLRGKVVMGVAQRAKKHECPVIAVAGMLEGNLSPAYEMGLTAAFATNSMARPFEEVQKTCRDDLVSTMDHILRIIKTLSSS